MSLVVSIFFPRRLGFRQEGRWEEPREGSEKPWRGEFFTLYFSGALLVSFSSVLSCSGDFSSFFSLGPTLLFFISNTLSFILGLLFHM